MSLMIEGAYYRAADGGKIGPMHRMPSGYWRSGTFGNKYTGFVYDDNGYLFKSSGRKTNEEAVELWEEPDEKPIEVWIGEWEDAE